MNISTFDILLLFLLAIVVSMIVGTNVMYVIDKKMSDISINIPDRQYPQPNIFIQTEDGKVKRVSMTINDSVNSSQNNQVERFGGSIGKNNLGDTFTDNSIQSTVIETDTDKSRVFLQQGYHTSPSERNLVNRGDAIINPRHDDILRYNGSGCYENLEKKGIRKVQLVNKPNLQRCEDRLHPAAVNTVRTQTMTANGDIVDKNVNFYIPHTYLGVAGQRSGMPTGYPAWDNIARTSGEPADIDQIGAIPVNNYEGEPVPVGSILME